MSMDIQQQTSRELDDIITFPGHDKAGQPTDASDPVNTVLGFINAGIMFEAATNIMDAVGAGSIQVAGSMPEGSGFEPAITHAPAPAPSMDPSINRTPGMGL